VHARTQARTYHGFRLQHVVEGVEAVHVVQHGIVLAPVEVPHAAEEVRQEVVRLFRHTNSLVRSWFRRWPWWLVAAVVVAVAVAVAGGRWQVAGGKRSRVARG
jgi:hypothetical protein